MYFDKIYVILYIISSSLLYVFKGYILPYPPGSVGPEVVGLVFFTIWQFIRLQLGKKKLFYPKVEIIHTHRKGSSKSIKLFIIHISSIIKYFMKWGFNRA